MNQFEVAIAALSAEIDADSVALKADRASLEKREQDLSVKIQARDMMKRFASGDTRLTPAEARHGEPVHASAQHDVIDLSDLVGDASAKRKTLIDDVRDVVRRLGRQEFSNAHVEAAMRRLGIEVVGKTPRSRISLAFAKLVDEHVLVRTFIGGGNVPHRYKLRSTMTSDEIASADAMNSAHVGPDDGQAATDDEDQPSDGNVARIA